MADDAPQDAQHTVHFQVPEEKKTPLVDSGDKDRFYNGSDSYGTTDSIEKSREVSGRAFSRQNSEKTPLMMSSRDFSIGINPGIGYRHLVVFMCFLGMAMNYALRVNLSVAIVAMVKNEDDAEALNVTSDQVCPADPGAAASQRTEGEFDWDAQTQGIILSAFFYGALATQLLGGVLADKLGGTRVFCGGIFLTSLFTILTPPLARYNVTLLIAARVIEGLGEGMTVPAMYVLLSKWSPRLERTQFGAFAMAGCNVGNVLGLALTGLLSDSSAGGWPIAFYTFGAAGMVWVLAWWLFVYESPSIHPNITLSERNYILVSTGDRLQAPPTPWRALLTSVPLWSIAAAHFGKNWVYFTLLTTLPSYMRQVLKFDVSKNGVLSSVPYLAMWVVEIVGSQLLDFLRRRKLISTTIARKTFNSIGVILTVVFLIVEGFVGCDKTLAVVILSLSTAFLGLTSCGFQVNHLDIAPVFAGTLMGFTNNIATIPGIVAPSVVTAITEAKPFPERWRIVFYISALVHLLGGFIFAVGASGKEQPWARQKPMSFVKDVKAVKEIKDQAEPHHERRYTANF